jgi:hypothetical protein
MRKANILLNTALLLASGLAAAGDFTPAKGLAPLAPPLMEDSCLSYNFIDLQYIHTDFGSGYFSDGQGYGGNFSKTITNNIFMTGSYSFSEFDDLFCGCNDVAENHRYRLGAGFRKPIADCVDLTFEGGGEFLDSAYQKNTNRNFDSWGYYVGPGIRARAGRFEMFANAFYMHSEGDNSQNHIWPQFRSGGYSQDPYGWRLMTGLIYHLTENFGLKVGAEVLDYDTNLLVGGRYNF